MEKSHLITKPFQFNPLKHHLEYIRHFTYERSDEEHGIDTSTLIRELKHIGTSVMDVYTGQLSTAKICSEVLRYLISNRLNKHESFSEWAGKSFSEFRILTLSDKSRWTLKYHNDKNRYVHLFPARMSPHTFRIKANTLKSAILYYIIVGKDFISRNDLNKARVLLGLSPVKDPGEAEAITEMIEMLRG
jgi:hypothetical protein